MLFDECYPAFNIQNLMEANHSLKRLKLALLYLFNYQHFR
jgi:hypothetical protein